MLRRRWSSWRWITERFLSCPVDEAKCPSTPLRVALPHRPVVWSLTVAVVKAQVAACLDKTAQNGCVASETSHMHRRAPISTSPANPQPDSISRDMCRWRRMVKKRTRNQVALRLRRRARATVCKTENMRRGVRLSHCRHKEMLKQCLTVILLRSIPTPEKSCM